MAIDPISGATASQSTIASKQLSADYENFLKLLTVQLQNQDPTNPTDTNELTQQIAMLSQVEQQISTNRNLERLIGLYGATQYNSLVTYIGKQIEAPGNTAALQDGRATIAYYVEDTPQSFTATIKDSTGQTVYTAIGTRNADGGFTWKDANGNDIENPPFSAPKSGRNEFAWDGRNSNGQDMENGLYTVELTAKSGGSDLALQTYITGVVTSVDSAGGVVYLSIGDFLSLPLEAITSIRQSQQTVAQNSPPPPVDDPPPADDPPPSDTP